MTAAAASQQRVDRPRFTRPCDGVIHDRLTKRIIRSRRGRRVTTSRGGDFIIMEFPDGTIEKYPGDRDPGHHEGDLAERVVDVGTAAAERKPQHAVRLMDLKVVGVPINRASLQRLAVNGLRVARQYFFLLFRHRHNSLSVGGLDNSSEGRVPGESQGSPGACSRNPPRSLS